ncbi:FG-GAP-like repeat-containing protein [Kitasatospora sp. NPDC004615]|uniref:FG-GAP-like repeat-containing protein n=1 Tax=Kitasatospora sp. NPDC004615 TaxID=3364017 RepID=UPI0036C93FB1
MKRPTSLALAAAIAVGVLSATAAPSSAATVPPTPAPLRVMPLGDSITAGVGSTSGAGYRLPLYNTLSGQSRYRFDLVGSWSGGAVGDPDNDGHSGALIDEITQNIDSWLAGAQPDVVLLHLGINDLDRGDRTHAPDRLAALVDRIAADRPTATVLVQGLIPTTGQLESAAQTFNAAVQAQLQSRADAGRKVRYLTPPALTTTEMNDRLHPNDKGYARMAQVFTAGLDQAFTDGLAVRPAAPRAGTEAGGAGRARFADFDGDGKADYIVVEDSGAVRVFLNKGGDGHGGWQDLGQVATGLTSDKSRVRFADFDGDGKADYLVIQPGGAVNVFLNKGGDGRGGWQDYGQVASGTTSNPDQVRFADFDGDGRADYVTIGDDGAVNVFLNRGGDGHGGWNVQGKVAGGVTTDRSRVRLADVTGDGRADYNVINPDGSITSYTNNGGDTHGGWTLRPKIAAGLTTDQNTVHLADITGDARADYLIVNGPTRAFANNGGDDTGGGWTDLGQIATGV